MFKKIDNETLWSGLFGIISIIAAIGEVFVNGMNTSNIIAAIKDVSGTVAVVFVLFIAIKHLITKEPKNFDEVFTSGMEAVTVKYNPLIQKQEDGKHRYFIASKLSAINDISPGAYHKFFDYVSNKEIEISFSKTVFVGVGGSDELFKEKKSKIVLSINNRISVYDIVDKCELSANGIKIKFNEPLETAKHANQLVEIIDCVLLSFVTEYNRA